MARKIGCLTRGWSGVGGLDFVSWNDIVLLELQDLFRGTRRFSAACNRLQDE